MTLTDASFSLLTQTQSTFVPGIGLLNRAEPYVNAADGTLWVGGNTDLPLEIGLNAKTGLIGDTNKFLVRDAGLTEINIPYDPSNLRNDEYFEFFILFNASTGPNARLYSQSIDWGSIPDPVEQLAVGFDLYVKFFSYGFSSAWYGVPVWSNDPALTIFGGSVDSKFYYTQVQAPSGALLPQRSILRFQSLTTATISDDIGNDATVVELGRNLVTRINGQPVVSLDYNLSEFYVLNGTTSLDLPGGLTPTDPFQFTVKNDGVLPITINQGSLSVLGPNDSALILYDGVAYSHILYSNLAGENNTASNLGGGEGIFSSKVLTDLQFKSLVAGTGVSLSSTSTEITINTAGSLVSVNEETLAGSKTLITTDEFFQVLDPNGVPAFVVLPDPPVTGSYFNIVNDSDNLSANGNTLTVRETAAGPDFVTMDDTTGLTALRFLYTGTKWIYFI